MPTEALLALGMLQLASLILVRMADVDGDGVVDNEMKGQVPVECANNGSVCLAHDLEETPYNAMSFFKSQHLPCKTQDAEQNNVRLERLYLGRRATCGVRVEGDDKQTAGLDV